MKELKEIRFNETDILLQDNLVRGSILPEKMAELNRNIIFKGNNVVEGPIYGFRIEIQKGDLEVQGAVYAQHELYVNSEATGEILFKKCVCSANSVTSRASKVRLTFNSDINAKSVTLYNAFVAGSIYADEIVLDNCVVIGGVFATQNIDMNNSIVGTFNTPAIRISGVIQMLLPSAFSIEPLESLSDTLMYNLSLADLGALYKGLPEAGNSGRIRMSLETDEIKSDLADAEVQKTLRCYTVVGKVLAADLLDTYRFQNHFLLTAASLGSQLLKTYDLGVGKDGQISTLTVGKIRDFFFDILNGKIQVQDMDGSFSLKDIAGAE